MATLVQQIGAERLVRSLLDQGDLPQPDVVEYGYTCIRLLWHERKVALVVDIAEAPEDGAADAVDPAHEDPADRPP